ncbi:hypothetical protein [Phenylobacterium sp.]|uniref:hypothetical protein n=1 Tax=Phenylobacterium sp. TaxID=1871053 RepID=UPI0019CC09B6|nr:hypothetical protein [Phenylobacterium sp.]MBC7169268.1 hypothetical protein [Phenylobacterium sp.]
MLTKADDFPIHQTPEPVAYAGTDRNFYDRYFFNGYSPDGATYFAVAFGVYPHLNVADAHFAVIRDGVEHCLHASKILHSERLDLTVGPITIEVVEPLQVLRVKVDGEGLAAEITFTGRAFPIEEPRFIRRMGPRAFMDYTRLTQNVCCEGWIAIDGDRRDLPAGSVGTRDRSWGVRPVGAPDPQPPVPLDPALMGFFWQWTPLNFETESVFFHVNADPKGEPWNTRAVVLPDGAAQGEGHVTEAARMTGVELIPGTRHAKGGMLELPLPEGVAKIRFEPILTFLMRGIGYSGAWRHGAYKGELVVEREAIDLAAADMAAPENVHIQALSKVIMTRSDGAEQKGMGIFEQLIAGPYKPYGLG